MQGLLPTILPQLGRGKDLHLCMTHVMRRALCRFCQARGLHTAVCSHLEAGVRKNSLLGSCRVGQPPFVPAVWPRSPAPAGGGWLWPDVPRGHHGDPSNLAALCMVPTRRTSPPVCGDSLLYDMMPGRGLAGSRDGDCMRCEHQEVDNQAQVPSGLCAMECGGSEWGGVSPEEDQKTWVSREGG